MTRLEKIDKIRADLRACSLRLDRPEVDYGAELNSLNKLLDRCVQIMQVDERRRIAQGWASIERKD